MPETSHRTTCIAAALILALAACGGRDGETVADTTLVAAPGAPATAGAALDAGEVEDRVEDALEADPTLRGFDLDADDDDNAIVLKGTVQTEAQKTQAEQAAMTVAGGLMLRNEVRVDPSAKADGAGGVDADDAADRVADALKADATLGALDIDVDDDDDRVVLKGSVSTAEQKTQAEQVARRIAGAVQVVNELRVK